MNTGRLRILLIEDNPGDVRLVEGYLAEAPGPEATLEAAGRLSDGLSALASNRFDAILLDLGLPDSQGLETLDRVLHAAPAAPIVVLTGLADDTVGLQAIERGAQEYLVKGPISSRSFGRIIRYAVERKKATEALAASTREWHATFDAISDPIWLADVDGRIQRCNKAAADLLERPVSDIIGQACCTLVHGTTEHIPECPLVRTRVSRRRESFEMQSAGRWFEIVCDPLLNECREVTGVVHVMTDITERKRAEHALRESEERFRLLAERSRDLIFRYRLKPTPAFEYVSPSCLTFTGYCPEDFYSDPSLYLKIVHADDRSLAGDVLRAGGGPTTMRCVKKDGTLVWTETQITPVTDSAGNLIAVEGTVRDTSGRLAAQERLRSSEERFRATFEQAPVGVAHVSLDGRWLRVNQTFCDFVGYRREELLEHGFEEITHSDDLPRGRDDVKKLIAGQIERASKEKRYICKDGSTIWVNLTTSLARGAEGEPEFLIAVTEDIRRRKEAEEALSSLQQRYRTIVETASEAIWTLDANYVISYVNPKMTELLGYTGEEMLGRPNLSFIAPEMRDHILEYRQERLKGRRGTYENRLMRKDGSVLITLSSVSPFFDDAGQFQGVVALHADITEMKAAQQELETSLCRLEETFKQTVFALASTIEQRDPYTAGHQRRSASLACAIARDMGLSQEQVKGIEMAGIIHDIGKVSIPTDILSTPRRLTEIEFGLIKMHAQAGYDILKNIEFPWPVAETVLQHHERMDGSGYPSGLTGENILLEARILAVADVVEAMISHRPYRGALGSLRALEEISKEAGSLYDPEVAAACLALFTEKGFRFE